jgi:hypothetical protein
MSDQGGPLPMRVVLCEGIHDTAFWGGALARLGATKGARSPYSAESRGYSSRNGAFIEFRQKGRKPSWSDLTQELIGAATRATSEIVLCVDLEETLRTLCRRARSVRKTCWKSLRESS